VDRKDLQSLSRIRLREAKALLRAGLQDGAYYLAGYAVECALKACIAKGTRRHEFPDRKRVDSSYTHNLRELARVAELDEDRLQREREDVEFKRNWERVRSWTEQSRYERYTREEAQALLRAIEDRVHGVMAWLRLGW